MVRDTLVTRCTTWLAIASIFTAMMPTASFAQQSGTADFESPIIEHEALEGGPVGGVEVFGATVVDNDEIARVVVFYRFSGETEFAELPMREVAESSYYSAKVDTANVPRDTESIEYYIQAEDASGNIVLKGFAFQPLTRAFEVPVPEAAALPSEPEMPEASGASINWLYVGLGVLIVGGIAAAASDSGGQSSGQDCARGCVVNLTFDPP